MALVVGGPPDPSAKALCDDARSSQATGLPGESTPHGVASRFEQRSLHLFGLTLDFLALCVARRQLMLARPA